MTIRREDIRPDKRRGHPPTRGHKAKARQPTIEARRAEATKLRVAGYPYRDIAQRLGVSLECAYSDVQAVLARTKEQANGLAQEVRDTSLERMDIAAKALLPKVQKGDTKAVEKLVAVEGRRAKLVGADAPEQRELTGKGGGPIEFSSPDFRKKLDEKWQTMFTGTNGADSEEKGRHENENRTGEPGQDLLDDQGLEQGEHKADS